MAAHVNLLGPRGYPAALKRMLVEEVETGGLTPREATEQHKMASERSIRRWKEQSNAGLDLGNLKPGPVEGSKFVLPGEDLEELSFIKSSFPDLYLHECLQLLEAGGCVGLTTWHISRGISFLGMTRKRLECHEEKRDEMDRMLFWLVPPPHGIFGADRRRLIDVEEFGSMLCTSTRSYGHSPQGEAAAMSAPTKVGAKFSTILAINCDGVLCASTADVRGTTKVIFEAFVEEVLLPNIPPHPHVIMMDNLASHKSEVVRGLVEAAGHQLVFRPLYSRDFGPVELAISDIKKFLRRHRYNIDKDNLIDFINLAMHHVGPFYDHYWHCGY